VLRDAPGHPSGPLPPAASACSPSNCKGAPASAKLPDKPPPAKHVSAVLLLIGRRLSAKTPSCSSRCGGAAAGQRSPIWLCSAKLLVVQGRQRQSRRQNLAAKAEAKAEAKGRSKSWRQGPGPEPRARLRPLAAQRRTRFMLATPTLSLLVVDPCPSIRIWFPWITRRWKGERPGNEAGELRSARRTPFPLSPPGKKKPTAFSLERSRPSNRSARRPMAQAMGVA